MKKKYAITLNIILIILEIIGLITIIINNHKLELVYYTEDSNIFALIISCVYLYYLLFKDKVPRIINILKYSSILCLTITFLVVIFVLAPMFNFNYIWFLFNGSFIFFHFLCPIIALISFLLFEEYDIYESKNIFYSMIPTLIYSIILIILNVVGKVVGPYPFLEIKNNSIIESILWLIGLLSSMFGISYILTYSKKKIKK